MNFYNTCITILLITHTYTVHIQLRPKKTVFCYLKASWNLTGTFTEIPLFHVLNARITFGNINGCDAAVEGVTTIEDAGKITASIDETSFDSPPGYRKLGKVIISSSIHSLREAINFLHVAWLSTLRVLNWFIPV